MSADPQAEQRRRSSSALPLVLIGVVGGLAWSASLRAYMVEFAGFQSTVHWAGTFLALLLPGALTGGLYGWAEAMRRRGRNGRWLAAAPLSFAVAPLLMPGAVTALLTEGRGGGAVAVAVALFALAGGAVAVTLFALAGGYALAGRGPLAARLVLGTVAAATVAALVIAGPSAGGQRLALTGARGAWVAVLGSSLLILLAIAASIPFRPVAAPAAPIPPPST